jgi:putative flippase GtrA
MMARKLVRYLFTGGAAAIVDIGGFGLLTSIHMPTIPAATTSFLAATLVNYLLTSRWVFHETPTLRRYAAFLAGTLVALVVNVALTSVGVMYVDLPWSAAKALAVGATFFLNFWINARIVFRRPPERSSA